MSSSMPRAVTMEGDSAVGWQDPVKGEQTWKMDSDCLGFQLRPQGRTTGTPSIIHHDYVEILVGGNRCQEEFLTGVCEKLTKTGRMLAR